MSVTINCKELTKKFGNNVIIPNLSLQIKNGEFFTLLGPSGCGKTTLLRMIIGFNSIENGNIDFDGKVINNIPANKRNIGMVFQNYAIFPHMNVFDNVAFGLTNRKMSKEEITKKVDEILKIVKIENLRDRFPEKMSGGQQQRVALARAIVIHPDVLLMDEPLSNLDAKLRIDMRNAIKQIQHEVGITTVYVTHDQEEALAISDRIAVMNGGVIQHVGTPKNIYQRPANVFVATFIGRSNLLDGTLKYDDKYILDCMGYSVELDGLIEEAKNHSKIKVSIRPEEFVIVDSNEGITGEIIDSVFLGLHTHYFVKLENGQTVETVQESEISDIIPIGTSIKLQLKTQKINIFTEDGSLNLCEGVINDVY